MYFRRTFNKLKYIVIPLDKFGKCMLSTVKHVESDTYVQSDYVIQRKNTALMPLVEQP